MASVKLPLHYRKQDIRCRHVNGRPGAVSGLIIAVMPTAKRAQQMAPNSGGGFRLTADGMARALAAEDGVAAARGRAAKDRRKVTTAVPAARPAGAQRAVCAYRGGVRRGR